jgi:hypothetical protein
MQMLYRKSRLNNSRRTYAKKKEPATEARSHYREQVGDEAPGGKIFPGILCLGDNFLRQSNHR